jgi:predicted ATPase
LYELATQALHTLAAHYAGRGEAGRAAGIEVTTRLLALEPWREEAHRQLMTLLAQGRQRGAALAQYETCRRVLAEELGVSPGAETTALYERIRDGQERPPVAVRPPHDPSPSDAWTVIAGRYEIRDPERDLLGRGGMGDVYRGTDLETGQSVAVKVLKPELVTGDPESVARFLREGEALRQLDHPNIVKIVDAVEGRYLVMECVAGGSLRDLLAEGGRLSVERAVEIALDVADALADLVYRMLRKDRGQRIPSVRLVGAELEAILVGGKGQEAGSKRQKAGGGYGPIAPSRFAAPTPPAERPNHNLPTQPVPFVGREAELRELGGLLRAPDVHLVTVLGAGGMGKTRLALQAAEMLAEQLAHDRFAHGACFIPLAPLQSVEAIVPTIAKALNFSFYEGGTPRQQLLDYLRQKSMLLLFDNYEHLLTGADVVAEILRTARNVSILATSRVRLNVQGEHRFHISGMDFPDWETPEDALEYSAVKLFLQSAQRAQPGFALQADDLKYVARICRLVGGMPLGILLAAAWVGMLTPSEIAAEIGRSLDFLETGLRDIPERQRSIRAVYDHSWRLLSKREKSVFQGLSVFRGGFTRQAAQEVTGASLRGLMSLVDRSLLRRAPTGRYEIHELLRQYAAEKLQDSPDAGASVRDQHSAYYASALQQWEVDLKCARQSAALAEMNIEIENARAAWDWAVERGHVEQLDQATQGLQLVCVQGVPPVDFQ